MATGQQTDQHAIDKMTLAHQHVIDLGHDFAKGTAGMSDAFGQLPLLLCSFGKLRV